MERNAIISHAELAEERGLLSSWITLDYGTGGQGFGGFSLHLPPPYTYASLTEPNFAGHWIWRVMAVAGVSKWSQLVGKTVRVRHEHSRVEAIGHIVKDDWFNPSDDFAKLIAASKGGL